MTASEWGDALTIAITELPHNLAEVEENFAAALGETTHADEYLSRIDVGGAATKARAEYFDCETGCCAWCGKSRHPAEEICEWRGACGCCAACGAEPKACDSDPMQPPTKTALPEETHWAQTQPCLLYTSPSPRDRTRSRMPSSA